MSIIQPTIHQTPSFSQRQVYNNSILSSVMASPHQGGVTDGTSNFSTNKKLFNNSVTNHGSKHTYNDTSSSSYIQRRKANAIGKTSTKQGLATNSSLTYDNVNKNTVNQSLRRIRSGGSVAPAKKSAK